MIPDKSYLNAPVFKSVPGGNLIHKSSRHKFDFSGMIVFDFSNIVDENVNNDNCFGCDGCDVPGAGACDMNVGNYNLPNYKEESVKDTDKKSEEISDEKLIEKFDIQFDINNEIFVNIKKYSKS